MPPSLDCIIGLPGVELERVTEEGNRVTVFAHCSVRHACVHCGASRSRIKDSFNRKLKHTRQGNRLIILVIRSHKFFCLVCERYFNLRIPGVLPKKKVTESFRMEVYEKHHGGFSQRLISGTHEIGEATVNRWFMDFTDNRVKELQGRCSPKIIGIDEHFFTRKKGYATTLCDLKNHKVFDVLLGRSEESLKEPLERIPERFRTKVAVIDLSETYKAIIKNHFPNALIVTDRFHVIRLVNHHFLKAWQLMDPVGRKNRGLLSLMRRHEKNLKPEQRPELQKYLDTNHVLKEVYTFKQSLCELLSHRSKNKTQLRPIIHELMAMISKLRGTTLEPLQTLGENLDRWKEEIGRMLRFSKSNGITEGFHTKMEMLTRRAFGFRNFQNYRRRVIAHCGWDGVFRRTETRQGTIPLLTE